MKIIFIILTSLILFNQSYSQFSKLSEYKTKLLTKVEVGISGEELKRKIGKPKAVQSGFPDTDEMIIIDLPDQKGQLNYSTWFYYYDIITINIPKTPDEKFIINGMEVPEGVFNDYKDLSEIYLFDGSIIYPQGRYDYQRKDSSKFDIQPKDLKKTKYVPGRVINEKKKFLPILCVLFDRGTQVVSSSMVLYKIIQ